VIRRILVICAVAAAAVLLVAGPAAAHVTVSSPSATQGGYGKLTFRVPNEKATASTVALEVTLPTARRNASPIDPQWICSASVA
jgi:periplasmic copper chaperone A